MLYQEVGHPLTDQTSQNATRLTPSWFCFRNLQDQFCRTGMEAPIIDHPPEVWVFIVLSVLSRPVRPHVQGRASVSPLQCSVSVLSIYSLNTDLENIIFNSNFANIF